jgi:magnesium chelatase subunit D
MQGEIVADSDGAAVVPARAWWRRLLFAVAPAIRADADAVLFSVKCFIAAMLAYYIALRIGLNRPFWAVVTAYIIAQPLAGAVLSKAAFRLMGTVVGAAAAVVLVPMFVNEPAALSLALALWLGFCLYLAQLDRTPRAYLFLLAGYTASIIGFPSVEAPGVIFTTAILRVQEITIGILCASLIHGAVFPRTVTKLLLLRIDTILADARRWSVASLTGAREATLDLERRRLAIDVFDLHQLSVHLPFDTARILPRVHTVRALQDRLSLLLPLASSIEDRLAELKRCPLGVPEAVAALVARTRGWIDDGVAALDREETAEVLIAEARALEPLALPDAPSASLREAPPPGGEDFGADLPDDILTALVGTAAALGVDSARAPLFALRAARAMARLAGRDAIGDEDVMLAARLVLAPRATRVPMAAEEPETEQPPPDAAPDSDSSTEDNGGELDPMEDIVLAAALAAIPKDVLARIAAGGGRRARAANMRGSGERRKSAARGRPMGTLAGVPGGGRRLSLIDTLRAAAPWQKLRGGNGRVSVRRDDLRIRRFQTRAEVLTIFAVDASGSSALARLAEAKGAVELLLAEAYVKRAQVALIAFRGTGAELLLPPTRSLARARRLLAELPGGGGTPLAAGLSAARDLAEAARARGRTPFVIVLTDGRANIAADGRAVRSNAEADATAAAKAIGAAGIAAVFVDISARPRPEGAAIAAAMGARYLPLPRADSATMHAAISQAQPA